MITLCLIIKLFDVRFSVFMVNTDDVLLFACETAGSKQEENTYPKKLIKKIFYC